MHGRYLRHPFPYLSIFPVVGVSPQRYCQCASIAAGKRLQSKKPIGERALGLVAAHKSAVTGSCSFDEARSPMGLRLRFTELRRVTKPSMRGL